jgi:hypothetical protein
MAMLDIFGNSLIRSKRRIADAGQTKLAFFLVDAIPAGVANKINYLPDFTF